MLKDGDRNSKIRGGAFGIAFYHSNPFYLAVVLSCVKFIIRLVGH